MNYDPFNLSWLIIKQRLRPPEMFETDLEREARNRELMEQAVSEMSSALRRDDYSEYTSLIDDYAKMIGIDAVNEASARAFNMDVERDEEMVREQKRRSPAAQSQPRQRNIEETKIQGQGADEIFREHEERRRRKYPNQPTIENIISNAYRMDSGEFARGQVPRMTIESLGNFNASMSPTYREDLQSGAHDKIADQVIDAMMNVMGQMGDARLMNAGNLGDNLRQLEGFATEVFGKEYADELKQQALASSTFDRRLPPEHPAMAFRDFGKIRSSEHLSRRGSTGPFTSQITLPEFDRNRNLSVPEADDLRYIANVKDVEEKFKRPLQQRELANRRVIRNPSGGSFRLVGDTPDGETVQISSIRGTNPDETGGLITDISGRTEEEFREQGGYRELLTALLNAGFKVRSDNRNMRSNPFHSKFLSTLPRHVEADIRPYRGLRSDNSGITLEEMKRRAAAAKSNPILANRYTGLSSASPRLRERAERLKLPITAEDEITYSMDKLRPYGGDLGLDIGAFPMIREQYKPSKASREAEREQEDKAFQTTFNLGESGRFRQMIPEPTPAQQRANISPFLPNLGETFLRPYNQLQDIARNRGQFRAVDENTSGFDDLADLFN